MKQKNQGLSDMMTILSTLSMSKPRNIVFLFSTILWIAACFVKANDQATHSQSNPHPTTYETPTEEFTVIPSRQLPNNFAHLKADLTSYNTTFTRCGEDVEYTHSSRTNVCYYYARTEHRNWNAVQAICKDNNAHLTIPSSLEKLEDVIKFIEYRNIAMYEMNVWIGLYYPDTSGMPHSSAPENELNWLWVDGTPYDRSVSQWNPPGPAAGDKWVRMRQGKWFATKSAADADFFVCEKAKTLVPSTKLTTEGPAIPGKPKELLALITLIIPIAVIIILVVFMRRRCWKPLSGERIANERIAQTPLSGNPGYVSSSEVQEIGCRARLPTPTSHENGHLSLNGSHLQEHIYSPLEEGEPPSYLSVIGAEREENASLRDAGTFERRPETAINAQDFVSVYPILVKKDSQGRSEIDSEYQMLIHSFPIQIDEPDLAGPSHTGESSRSSSEVIKIFNFERKNTFITTKTPQQNSSKRDYWEAVQRIKSSTIIDLSSPQQVEACDAYDPQEVGDSRYVDPYMVKCTSVERNNRVWRKKLILSSTDSQDKQILHVSVRDDLSTKSSTELEEIFYVIYQDFKKQDVNMNHMTPVLVHCSDGAKWTGLFCAYCFVLDQIQAQNQIDIFQVVRRVRSCCNRFIVTKSQYSQLHLLIFNRMKNSSSP